MRVLFSLILLAFLVCIGYGFQCYQGRDAAAEVKDCSADKSGGCGNITDSELSRVTYVCMSSVNHETCAEIGHLKSCFCKTERCNKPSSSTFRKPAP